MKGNAGLCRVLSGTLVYSGYCGVLGIMKGLGRVFHCQVLLGSAGSTWQYPAVPDHIRLFKYYFQEISGGGNEKDGTYVLKTLLEDTSNLPIECKDGCVYTKDGEG